MTIEEYKEALSVSLSDKFLDTKRLPSNMNRVIREFLGLTFIDDEEHTVHYVHQSVEDHLFHTEHREAANFDAQRIDEHFGYLCMTYLNFANFSRQIAKVEKEVFHLLDLGTPSIYPDSLRVNRMARKLLLSRKGRSPGVKVREIERAALQSLKHVTTDAMQNDAFLVYAKDNWWLHLKELEIDDRKMWLLFCKCLEVPAFKPALGHITPTHPRRWRWAFTFTKSWSMALFSVALDQGLPEAKKLQVFCALLGKMKQIDAMETRFALEMALRRALITKKMLEFLLSVDKAFYQEARVVNDQLDDDKANAYFNMISSAQRDPLLLLSLLDKQELVATQILDSGADANVLAQKSQDTALHLAADLGQLFLVQELVIAGADLNLQDKVGKTSVHRALKSDKGGLEVLWYLITAGADVNLRMTSPRLDMKDYLVALTDEGKYLSTLGGDLADLAQANAWSAVRMLAKNGVDVNIRGRDFRKIALHWAGERGEKDMVALLVDKRSDPNTLDTYGQTAMHYYAESGFEKVTAYLLKVTDASVVDTKGRTALRCARDNSHSSIVRMLLPFAGLSDHCLDDNDKSLEY
ncbi:ankyrin [Penicillium malachiteum]|uniref:ankyrin n=1 Tax=Penicillium malachiteum TaxID=1324776 RepID=UPI002546E31C|nr:ankyrin [Penicillium malachiteum]KAJ5713368.1 ankyrin [Penicillium malachiteum]